jgi:poly [ADP-ribose] polymerase
MVRAIKRSATGKAPTKAPPTLKAMPPTTTTATATAPRSPARSGASSGASVGASTAVGKVDAGAHGALLKFGTIVPVYQAMLNQTNIAQNNNKFYKLQLVTVSRDSVWESKVWGSGVYLFTRWGRVGEFGATQEQGPFELATAVKQFEAKFKAKTGNAWANRGGDVFVPKAKKYTPVDMEEDEAAAIAQGHQASSSSSSSSTVAMIAKCALEAKTKDFVDLIFDEDMFKSAMRAMNIDIAKLPLGALSKAQLDRGFDALALIEQALSAAPTAPPTTAERAAAIDASGGAGDASGGGGDDELMRLSSAFYTAIPHAFGRMRPPTLDTLASVKEKVRS